MDTSSLTALEEARLAVLLRQAPREFARVVYGLSDRAGGRISSLAAEAVIWAQHEGMPVSRDRAEQRARAYLPVAGHEHCPRCWVLGGAKHLLQYRQAAAQEGTSAPELALCRHCGAEYCALFD